MADDLLMAFMFRLNITIESIKRHDTDTFKIPCLFNFILSSAEKTETILVLENHAL